MTLVTACKNILPPFIWSLLRSLRHPDRISRENEICRLLTMPRYQSGVSDLPNFQVNYVDGPSFAAQYREIFIDEVYALPTSIKSPVIIDCGANIGMALAYWRQRYPDAKITCYEPDPLNFSFLNKNAASLPKTGTTNLIPKAVWNCECELLFDNKGGDSGRISDKGKISISAVKLSQHIKGNVDLLKLDIEGAEALVIEDATKILPNINRIVMEYHSFPDCPQRLGSIIQTLDLSGYRLSVRHLAASLHPFIDDRSPHEHDLRLLIHAWRDPPLGM